MTVETGLEHVVCCDDDRALCGQNVRGEPWAALGKPREPGCPTCTDRCGKPCGPDCREWTS